MQDTSKAILHQALGPPQHKPLSILSIHCCHSYACMTSNITCRSNGVAPTLQGLALVPSFTARWQLQKCNGAVDRQ